MTSGGRRRCANELGSTRDQRQLLLVIERSKCACGRLASRPARCVQHPIALALGDSDALGCAIAGLEARAKAVFLDEMRDEHGELISHCCAFVDGMMWRPGGRQCRADLRRTWKSSSKSPPRVTDRLHLAKEKR